uniref:7TMR-DISMED2 domain-containing protein n=1 Tax=Stutzerimonas balearica TaxID=74829 RepID=UPI0028AA0FD3
MKRVVPSWWLWLLLLAHGLAQASWHETGTEPVALGGRWALLVDPDERLSVEDLERPGMAARFMTQQGNPGLGYRSGAVWLRLQLDRPAADIPIWWLDLQSSTLDEVVLYQRRADGSFRQAVAGDTATARRRTSTFAIRCFVSNSRPKGAPPSTCASRATIR